MPCFRRFARALASFHSKSPKRKVVTCAHRGAVRAPSPPRRPCRTFVAVSLGHLLGRNQLAVGARMPRLPAALARLPSLLLRSFSLSPLLWSVTRRRPMRITRVLTQLLGELSQPLLQLSDAPILLGDARGLLGDGRILRREFCLKLCDPIVSPIALHDPPHDRVAAGWKALSNLWSKVDHLRRYPRAPERPRREGLNGYFSTSAAERRLQPASVDWKNQSYPASDSFDAFRLRNGAWSKHYDPSHSLSIRFVNVTGGPRECVSDGLRDRV